VAAVDRPRAAGTDPDIRYLDRDEVEALLRAIPDDRLGPTDQALYPTATMAGLRQGELIALRWRDVDWVAGVIRGTPDLHPRAVRDAEVQALESRRADG
jgi:integrase